jgi:hypothetical protein
MNSNKSPKDSEMSDVAIARNIVTGIWPLESKSRKQVIARAFDALKAIERALPAKVLRERNRQWTERRVRSIVDGEPIRVEHYEMSDLERMAQKEARREFRQSVSRAQRMAAFLTATDADFHEPEIDRLRQFFGEMDRA